MNEVEKRDFMHSHLHRVGEPFINEIYDKMLSLIDDSLIEESEEDIKTGKLVNHKALKKEVQNWRTTE